MDWKAAGVNAPGYNKPSAFGGRRLGGDDPEEGFAADGAVFEGPDGETGGGELGAEGCGGGVAVEEPPGAASRGICDFQAAFCGMKNGLAI